MIIILLIGNITITVTSMQNRHIVRSVSMRNRPQPSEYLHNLCNLISTVDRQVTAYNKRQETVREWTKQNLPNSSASNNLKRLTEPKQQFLLEKLQLNPERRQNLTKKVTSNQMSNIKSTSLEGRRGNSRITSKTLAINSPFFGIGSRVNQELKLNDSVYNKSGWLTGINRSLNSTYSNLKSGPLHLPLTEEIELSEKSFQSTTHSKLQAASLRQKICQKTQQLQKEWSKTMNYRFKKRIPDETHESGNKKVDKIINRMLQTRENSRQSTLKQKQRNKTQCQN